MIPTDIVPPRVPGPAVSGVGQKAGNKGAAGREEVSFAHAMKKVAGDKDAAPQATAGDKPAKAGPLARWHRLELRGALSAGAENDAGEADAPGDGETGRDGEAEVSGEGVATQGTAHGMLSALSAHPHPQPHPHAVAAVTVAEPGAASHPLRSVAPEVNPLLERSLNKGLQ